MISMALAALVITGPGSASSAALPTKPQEEEAVRVGDVEVVGRRGAALVLPEIELNEADIDVMGAWDIGALLRRMTENFALGGEPMVLINGKRSPNSGAFSGFPPGALARAELLPPEAASLYGAAPGQRVVNLVLQKNFSSHDALAVLGRPTQGGTSSLAADLRKSSINGESTHQLGVKVSRDTALRAEERDFERVDQAPDGGLITLRPQAQVLAANANLMGAVGEWSSVLSLNGQAEDTRSVAAGGIGNVEGRRRAQSLGGSAGASGVLGGWSVQGNANVLAARSREVGLADIEGENFSAGLNGSGSRTLVDLPAGPLVANISGGVSGIRSTVRAGGTREETTFYNQEVRASLAVPLSKARGGPAIGRALGDVMVTMGGSLRQTSAGDSDEINTALAWTPRRKIRLNSVWSVSGDSVSDAQRFEPQYLGTPRAVFDFRSGRAVEIVPILGGNPDLSPPRSERLSVAATVGPFTAWTLSSNLGYQRLEQKDGIGVLPDLTPDIEAAFPDRFQRDAEGRLTSVDYRPLNLHGSATETLNAGLNFSLPRAAGALASEATTMRFALQYNFRLKNEVVLLEGRPSLDKLRGDGGGLPKQDVRIAIDAQRGRWTLNVSGRSQDGYRTRRTGGQDGPGDLLVRSFSALDFKLTYQAAALPIERNESKAGRRVGGLQMGLEVSNLFDERPEAKLGDGAPAPGYGRDMFDPIGRTVRLTLQRRF